MIDTLKDMTYDELKSTLTRGNVDRSIEFVEECGWRADMVDSISSILYDVATGMHARVTLYWREGSRLYDVSIEPVAPNTMYFRRWDIKASRLTGER